MEKEIIEKLKKYLKDNADSAIKHMNEAMNEDNDIEADRQTAIKDTYLDALYHIQYLENN